MKPNHKRCEPANVYVEHVSLIYGLYPIEFFAFGLKSNSDSEVFDIALCFAEDAILEATNIKTKYLVENSHCKKDQVCIF